MVVRAFPVLELPKGSGGHVVLEVEAFLLGCLLFVVAAFFFLLLFFLGRVLFGLGALFILRRLDLELERVLLGGDELDSPNRQVSPIPRIFRQPRQLCGNPVVVEDRCLGAARWIYQEERLAVRRLPFVPEAIATLDPVGAERSAVGEPVQLVRSEARSKLVVRRRYPAVFLGGDGMTLKEE